MQKAKGERWKLGADGQAEDRFHRGSNGIAPAGTCGPKPVVQALRQICETNPNDGRD